MSKLMSASLAVDDILLDVQVDNTRQLFDAVGRHMQLVHGVPADSVVASLLRRESAGSTALGHGVAVPHARVTELDRIRVLYARLTPPLACETPDHEAVTDAVVLLVPAPAAQEHLDLLAYVATLFSDKTFRQVLHLRQQPAQIRELFVSWPA